MQVTPLDRVSVAPRSMPAKTAAASAAISWYGRARSAARIRLRKSRSSAAAAGRAAPAGGGISRAVSFGLRGSGSIRSAPHRRSTAAHGEQLKVLALCQTIGACFHHRGLKPAFNPLLKTNTYG